MHDQLIMILNNRPLHENYRSSFKNEYSFYSLVTTNVEAEQFENRERGSNSIILPKFGFEF